MNTTRTALFMTCCCLSGCVGITYEHQAADGIRAVETIAIVRNPQVDDQFVEAVIDWFEGQGLSHQVVDKPPANGWALTYKASWSWDITFYLSDVRVAATHDSKEVGYATYNVYAGAWSLDMGKWNADKTVVNKLMERLYSANPTPARLSAAGLSVAEAPGTVLLTSNVEGARVYVDGAFVGNAPATLKLTAGDHIIKVHEGEDAFYEQTIRVMAGSQAALKADK